MITWASRIRDLQSAGMTFSEIGEQVGLATSSIGDLANGHTISPRGDAAIKLHQLHAEKCLGTARERTARVGSRNAP